MRKLVHPLWIIIYISVTWTCNIASVALGDCTCQTQDSEPTIKEEEKVTCNPKNNGAKEDGDNIIYYNNYIDNEPDGTEIKNLYPYEQFDNFTDDNFKTEDNDNSVNATESYNGNVNTSIIYLAGYDDEILKLKHEIQEHGGGNEIVIYFYLYKDLKYHCLGHVCTNLKTLQETIFKYTHFFCIDNISLKSTSCLDKLGVSSKLEDAQCARIIQEIDNNEKNVVEPELSTDLQTNVLYPQKIEDKYEFILPKQNDITANDIVVDLYKQKQQTGKEIDNLIDLTDKSKSSAKANRSNNIMYSDKKYHSHDFYQSQNRLYSNYINPTYDSNDSKSYTKNQGKLHTHQEEAERNNNFILSPHITTPTTTSLVSINGIKVNPMLNEKGMIFEQKTNAVEFPMHHHHKELLDNASSISTSTNPETSYQNEDTQLSIPEISTKDKNMKQNISLIYNTLDESSSKICPAQKMDSFTINGDIVGSGYKTDTEGNKKIFISYNVQQADFGNMGAANQSSPDINILALENPSNSNENGNKQNTINSNNLLDINGKLHYDKCLHSVPFNVATNTNDRETTHIDTAFFNSMEHKNINSNIKKPYDDHKHKINKIYPQMINLYNQFPYQMHTFPHNIFKTPQQQSINPTSLKNEANVIVNNKLNYEPTHYSKVNPLTITNLPNDSNVWISGIKSSYNKLPLGINVLDNQQDIPQYSNSKLNSQKIKLNRPLELKHMIDSSLPSKKNVSFFQITTNPATPLEINNYTYLPYQVDSSPAGIQQLVSQSPYKFYRGGENPYEAYQQNLYGVNYLPAQTIKSDILDQNLYYTDRNLATALNDISTLSNENNLLSYDPTQLKLNRERPIIQSTNDFLYKYPRINLSSQILKPAKVTSETVFEKLDKLDDEYSIVPNKINSAYLQPLRTKNLQNICNDYEIPNVFNKPIDLKNKRMYYIPDECTYKNIKVIDDVKIKEKTVQPNDDKALEFTQYPLNVKKIIEKENIPTKDIDKQITYSQNSPHIITSPPVYSKFSYLDESANLYPDFGYSHFSPEINAKSSILFSKPPPSQNRFNYYPCPFLSKDNLQPIEYFQKSLPSSVLPFFQTTTMDPSASLNRKENKFNQGEQFSNIKSMFSTPRKLQADNILSVPSINSNFPLQINKDLSKSPDGTPSTYSFDGVRKAVGNEYPLKVNLETWPQASSQEEKDFIDSSIVPYTMYSHASTTPSPTYLRIQPTANASPKPGLKSFPFNFSAPKLENINNVAETVIPFPRETKDYFWQKPNKYESSNKEPKNIPEPIIPVCRETKDYPVQKPSESEYHPVYIKKQKQIFSKQPTYYDQILKGHSVINQNIVKSPLPTNVQSMVNPFSSISQTSSMTSLPLELQIHSKKPFLELKYPKTLYENQPFLHNVPPLITPEQSNDLSSETVKSLWDQICISPCSLKAIPKTTSSNDFNTEQSSANTGTPTSKKKQNIIYTYPEKYPTDNSYIVKPSNNGDNSFEPQAQNLLKPPKMTFTSPSNLQHTLISSPLPQQIVLTNQNVHSFSQRASPLLSKINLADTQLPNVSNKLKSHPQPQIMTKYTSPQNLKTFATSSLTANPAEVFPKSEIVSNLPLLGTLSNNLPSVLQSPSLPNKAPTLAVSPNIPNQNQESVSWLNNMEPTKLYFNPCQEKHFKVISSKDKKPNLLMDYLQDTISYRGPVKTPEILSKNAIYKTLPEVNLNTFDKFTVPNQDIIIPKPPKYLGPSESFYPQTISRTPNLSIPEKNSYQQIPPNSYFNFKPDDISIPFSYRQSSSNDTVPPCKIALISKTLPGLLDTPFKSPNVLKSPLDMYSLDSKLLPCKSSTNSYQESPLQSQVLTKLSENPSTISSVPFLTKNNQYFKPKIDITGKIPIQPLDIVSNSIPIKPSSAFSSFTSKTNNDIYNSNYFIKPAFDIPAAISIPDKLQLQMDSNLNFINNKNNIGKPSNMGLINQGICNSKNEMTNGKDNSQTVQNQTPYAYSDSNDLLSYLTTIPDISKNNIKDLINKFQPSQRVAIPLNTIGIAKYEPKQLNNKFNIKTENPDIEIQAWASKLKVLKPEIIINTGEIETLNFIPIVKELGKYDFKTIADIVKKYVIRLYGEPIILNGVFSPRKPYAYCAMNESYLKNGKAYIIWPTLCNCGCLRSGCQCT